MVIIIMIIIYLPTAPLQHKSNHLRRYSTRPQSLVACHATGQQSQDTSLSQTAQSEDTKKKSKRAEPTNLASQLIRTHTLVAAPLVCPIPGWTPQSRKTLHQKLTPGTMMLRVSPDCDADEEDNTDLLGKCSQILVRDRSTMELLPLRVLAAVKLS